MSNEQRTIVVANWKCNPTSLEQAEALFNSIKKRVGDSKKVEVVICPPFVWLPFLMRASASAKSFGGLAFGSQNCFWEQFGPFTGEISPQILKNLGCEYVILGHSERRQYLGETDEIIAKKLKASLKAGLKPIFCIGETEKQRKQKKTKQILKKQLDVLGKIQNLKSNIKNLNIAYEPIWAISTANGMAARPDDAKQAKILIEEILYKELSTQRPTVRGIKILYGGSADSGNAKEYIEAGFDGLLVGGASLNAKEFIKIVKSLDKI